MNFSGVIIKIFSVRYLKCSASNYVDYEVYDNVLHTFDDEDEELDDVFYEEDVSYDEDVFYEEDEKKIKAGFEGWVIYWRDHFQCKVTSKNKKKKSAIFF